MTTAPPTKPKTNSSIHPGLMAPPDHGPVPQLRPGGLGGKNNDSRWGGGHWTTKFPSADLWLDIDHCGCMYRWGQRCCIRVARLCIVQFNRGRRRVGAGQAEQSASSSNNNSNPGGFSSSGWLKQSSSTHSRAVDHPQRAGRGWQQQLLFLPPVSSSGRRLFSLLLHSSYPLPRCDAAASGQSRTLWRSPFLTLIAPTTPPSLSLPISLSLLDAEAARSICLFSGCSLLAAKQRDWSKSVCVCVVGGRLEVSALTGGIVRG